MVAPKRKFNKMTSQESRDEDLKVIKVYPKEKCKEPGCCRNAVGAHDVCKKHGGDPVIVDNLLKTYEISDHLVKLTRFNPAFHSMEYIKLSQQGLSEVEIASRFNVSVSVMRGWAEKFEDFYIATQIGKDAHEAWWINEAKRNLDNRNYNTSLFKYVTQNKTGWAEKSTTTNNLNVTAGVLAVPLPAKSNDEWEADYGAKDKDICP